MFIERGDIINTIIFMVLFLCFVFYLTLGIYIYVIDRKSETNKTFFRLCICYSIWAFGYAIMLGSSDISSAFFWRSISAFGYCFFIGYWWYFAFLLYNPNSKKVKNRITLLTYIFSAIFFIGNLTFNPSEALKLEYYGWIDISPANIIQIMFDIWCSVVYAVGSIIMFLGYKASKKNRVKKQIKIILITSIMSFCIGIGTDVVLPFINASIFPFAVIAISISMGGTYYAINKHGMMSSNPKFVSEYIFDTINEPVFILSDDFSIENCNSASLKATGFTYEELYRRIFGTLIEYENFDFNAIMENGYVKNIEVELHKKEADYISCELSGTVIHDEYDDILGIIILLHDISERKKISEIEKSYTLMLEEINLMLKNQIKNRIRAEKQISHFVYYDELTELPNRKKMIEDINALIKNKDENFAVLFIDLDGFKSINDNFGHQIGDMVLKCVADKLKEVIGENDTISRIGGDEFIIILGKLKITSYIKEIAEKIQEVLKKPIMDNENKLFVGASIGISIFPEHGTDLDNLIKKADLAMYEVKNNGGYGYIKYSPKMDNKIIDKLNMKIKFQNALSNNEFLAYCQPIMDLKSMKVINAEALIRWKTEDKIISPIEFIPMAKSVGEMVAIDNWMLENACIKCKEWQELGVKDFAISVNTSYTQLKQPNFVSAVENILKTHSILPMYLNLEITEDEAMEAPEEIIKILSELRKIGIMISLDDFGTGYSSFSYVNKLPIDKIKIDRSLIMNLNEDYKNTMIVKSIIMMGHNLNIKIIAEGIETEEQLTILKNLECDFIQGYLIGKPMDVVEFEDKFISKAYERK